MKKILFSVLFLAAANASVKAQDKKPMPAPGTFRASDIATQQPISAGNPTAQTTGNTDPDAGVFKFKEETHDYKEVPEGPLAEYDFEFKNVGKKPIIISEAHGSCGCTVPKWPTDPILPKHKGVIHVTYNTQGRVGAISKDVFITSNAKQNPMKLHITGTVKAKPDAKTPLPAVPPAPAVGGNTK